jgi:hypothetical protein
VLPPETERVWGFLQTQPALAGFVLLGGSALALRIQHRQSEDLDLAWHQNRLPRARLDSLRHAADSAGFDFQPVHDEATISEFHDSGLDLHDFQQNYLVNNNVRVSFFAPEPSMLKVLEPAGSAVRLGTLVELFKTKCLVSAQRSKTRDWLDLYLLLRDYGFTMRDYHAAFVEAGLATQCDTALSRLSSGVPQKDDEGYAHLLSNPPPLDEMTAFFVKQREQLEIELATEAKRRQGRSRGSD